MPSLTTIRRFVYARLERRGALERHELAMWLRREHELRELHAAIDALEHRARLLLARGGDA